MFDGRRDLLEGTAGGRRGVLMWPRQREAAEEIMLHWYRLFPPQ